MKILWTIVGFVVGVVAGYGAYTQWGEHHYVMAVILGFVALGSMGVDGLLLLLSNMSDG